MKRVKIDLRQACKKRVNPAFWPLTKTDKRYVVLRGGSSSGKSEFASFWHLLSALSTSREPHRILNVRKVAKTLEQSQYAQYKAWISRLNLGRYIHITKSPLYIRCAPTGSEMLFAGLDDVEKLKSIVRITRIWVEEASELAEADFEQLDLRMRGKSSHIKQLWLSFNPVYSRHWLKKRFWDRIDPNAETHVSTYRDNYFLAPEDVATIESYRQLNYPLYRVYGLGEWGVLKGRIYNPLVVLPQSDWPTPAQFSDECFGVDFGYNNPMAVIRMQGYDGEPYLTEEIYAKHLTTSDLIARMGARGLPKDPPYYCDAAEPDRIEELRRAGYNALPAEKGPGSVEAGIAHVQSYPRVYCRESDVNLLEENEAYCWQLDADENPLDKPMDFMNHAMDAVRYALWSHWGKTRPKVLIGRTVGDF